MLSSARTVVLQHTVDDFLYYENDMWISEAASKGIHTKGCFVLCNHVKTDMLVIMVISSRANTPRAAARFGTLEVDKVGRVPHERRVWADIPCVELGDEVRYLCLHKIPSAESPMPRSVTNALSNTETARECRGRHTGRQRPFFP